MPGEAVYSSQVFSGSLLISSLWSDLSRLGLRAEKLLQCCFAAVERCGTFTGILVL